MLSTSTRFGDGTVAGSIMITDTRPGSVSWNASVQASDFAGPDGAVINAANLGLDDLAAIAVPGNALAPTDLELINRPGAVVPLAAGKVSPAGLAHQPHTFATATSGHIGTIGITGRLALVAPTSAEPGLYTAILTFTVV